MTLHFLAGYPAAKAWPISRPVQRLAGIRRLERNARRWRLCVCRMDLRGDLLLGMPCAASMPTSKPGRPRFVCAAIVPYAGGPPEGNGRGTIRLMPSTPPYPSVVHPPR